jgi:Holliday junction DNA helicase RuvA
MIAQIQGKLISKTTSLIIVNNHGIGYEVLIPLSTYYELPDVGNEVDLFIYTYFKQEAILLVGFASEREKQLFKLMISITGIGPRLAVNILSGISADELNNAVVNNDLKRLLKVPGLGRKMAERVILELRDKVTKCQFKEQSSYIENKNNHMLEEDAISALINLGYKSQPAKETIDKIIAEGIENNSMDVILKKALKMLTI